MRRRGLAATIALAAEAATIWASRPGRAGRHEAADAADVLGRLAQALSQALAWESIAAGGDPREALADCMSARRGCHLTGRWAGQGHGAARWVAQAWEGRISPLAAVLAAAEAVALAGAAPAAGPVGPADMVAVIAAQDAAEALARWAEAEASAQRAAAAA